MSADVSTEELRARLPQVTVVDALGSSYFCNGHIPGAVNIPTHRVTELAATLLPDRAAPIVVYGANQDSGAGDAVARQLAAMGYSRVLRYAGGKEAWLQAGLPLEADGES